MSRMIHKWMLPLGVFCLHVSVVWGQSPPMFPSQAGVQPASSGASPTFSVFPSTTLYETVATRPDRPHAGDGTLQDRNGNLLIGNSLLDGPDPLNLGWYATVELDVLNVQVRSGLRNNLTRPDGTVDAIAVPYSGPNWTAAPRFEVGYRFGEGAGELLASYRFVISSGSETTSGFDPAGNPGAVQSKMNMHIFDLDYGSKENSLLPFCDMKWRAGIRIASIYFDSTETSSLLQQRNADSFFGAGPHAALDLNRNFADSKLGMFFKMDLSGTLGQVAQSFEETAGGFNGATFPHQWVPSASLMVQAGVTWTPTPAWRLSCGYTYEHWWDVGFAGQITQPATFSRADISMQGVMFRGEWKF